jgi:hypothetical protein
MNAKTKSISEHWDQQNAADPDGANQHANDDRDSARKGHSRCTKHEIFPPL